MKSTRLLGLTGLFIGGVIVLAACGSDSVEVVPTPVFEPTAAPAGQAPAAATAAPQETAVTAPTEAPAPQETAVTAPTEAPASPAGDAGNGEALFGANGCSGCHSTGSNRVVGPGLSGIGTTGESRVAGLSADQYVNDSIVSPNDFIVEGFSPGLMPGTFGETLSEQDVADLVAYLISLP